MLRKHLYLFTLLLLFSFSSFAQQKQAAWWFFGDSAAVNFNTTPPKALSNSVINTRIDKSCASISDEKGNLLFYTNGNQIWNRNHQTMWALPYYDYAYGTTIIPDPADSKQFYIFKKRYFGIYYTIVNMRLNNGLGGVDSSATGQSDNAIPNYSPAGNIGVMLHQNEVDYWLISHKANSDSIYAYLINSRGIQAPIISRINEPQLASISSGARSTSFKSSPNSRKLAYLTRGLSSDFILLMNFNRSTGALTLDKKITNSFTPFGYLNDMSFSPDSKLLYVPSTTFLSPFRGGDTILVYQLNLAQVQAFDTLKRNNVIAYLPPAGPDSTYQVNLPAIQLGIDGKLYISVRGRTHLAVINCPNTYGPGCGVQDSALSLLGRKGGESLPVFNQTLFRNTNNLQALAASDTICYGDTVRLSAFGAGAETFRWFPAPSLLQDSLAEVQARPLQTTTYTVIGTGACGQVDTAQVTVMVRAKPLAQSITGPTGICPNQHGIIYRIHGDSSLSYDWGISGGSIVSAATDSAVVNWAGTNAQAKIWAVPLNIFGCPGDTVFLNVQIGQQVKLPAPNGNDTICANIPVSYSTYTVPGAVYQWQAQGGQIISGQGSASVQVAWQQSGKLWVEQISRTSTDTCFLGSDSLSVHVLPSPDTTLSISGPDSICFNSTATYALAGSTSSTYNWQVQGGQILSGQNTNTVQVKWQQSGSISVTETNSQGCSGKQFSKTITVIPLPAAQVNPNSDLTFCIDNLSSRTYRLSTSQTGNSYNWIISGGAITSGQGSEIITVNWQPKAKHQLKAVPVSAFGCQKDTITFPLFYDGTTLDFVKASYDSVSGKDLMIKYDIKDFLPQAMVQLQEFRNGQWQQVSNLSLTNNLHQLAATQTGPQRFRLAYVNSCGNELVTEAHQAVWLQATTNEQTAAVQLTWNAYQGWNGRTNYQVWQKIGQEENMLLRTTDTAATLHTGRDAFEQQYYILAENNSLRSFSNIVTINFENKLVFYNVITPNNDGKNEAFVVENLHLYPNSSLKIFNRWGQQVYENNNYDNSWKAENISSGTYFYLLTTSNGNQFKGWVEVLK